VNKFQFGLPVTILGILIAFPAFAVEQSTDKSNNIPSLSDIKLPATKAELLTEQPASNEETKASTLEQLSQAENTAEKRTDKDSEINLDVTGQKDSLPESAPTYIIEKEEIQRQSPKNVADVLKRLPGFVTNNQGRSSDIHSGTFYRGASNNQTIILLNGRPINSNVNILHGGFDYNSIPVDSIERIELSSGTSTTLYGSQAFGGIVNIITKKGERTPKLNAGLSFGSFGENNQRINYGGGTEKLSYNLGFERYRADNRYKVPADAYIRDAQGYLPNSDAENAAYIANFSYDVDKKNTVNFDAIKTTSRRGLTVSRFNRLDQDVLNLGLSWKVRLGEGNNSVITSSFGYNNNYFNTYDLPGSARVFTSSLDSKILSGRIEHQWQTSPNNNLHWGLDLQNHSLLTANTNRGVDIGGIDKGSLRTALFALNTVKIGNNFNLDLGLRGNFDEFSSTFNPSGGFRWQASPTVAVRSTLASVKRLPGLDQLYVYDGVHNTSPNADLKPENGYAWTAGIDVNFSKNFTGQFTYFGNSIKDRIGSVSGRFANIGKVDTNGFEAALKWQVSPKWSTFLNYTYTDAKIVSNTASRVQEGLQLGGIPYSVAALGIGYADRGWEANLFANYSSGSRQPFGSATRGALIGWRPRYVQNGTRCKVLLS
jgi:outer membrane receptor protein involved in Fe transport